ncbi:MAG: CopG family transcriptional regulator [Solirubrobacteraceae bacterium]
MRTTLTLDDDVAAAISRRRAERGTGLRDEVNDLLRAGLSASSLPGDPSGDDYRLPTFDPGRALVSDPRALKDLLDEEDVERGLPRASG